MIIQRFNKAFHDTGNGYPSIKSSILRQRTKEDLINQESSCDVACNLSDERTFFAWQRNHMANERTFLAWCRTGIALIVFGFVIERFDLLIRELRFISDNPVIMHATNKTKYLGIITFALGAMIIILAGWRFFYIRRHINHSETQFTSLPDIFLLGSVLFTIFMIFVFFLYLV
jgi:putative membrane protein